MDVPPSMVDLEAILASVFNPVSLVGHDKQILSPIAIPKAKQLKASDIVGSNILFIPSLLA